MKNKFDNKLTDKGWKSMRRLLDREMPVQRQRRRFAWWPFLLLLPLAGVGAWWSFGSEVSEKARPKPVAAPKVSAPVAAVPSLRKESAHTPDGLKSSGELPGTDVVQEVNATQGTGENVSVATPAAYQRVFPPYRGGAPGDAGAHEHGLLSNVGAAAENTTSSGNIPDDSKASDEPRSSTGTAALPALLPPAFPTFEKGNINAVNLYTVSAYQPKIIKKQPAPQRWSFGAGAGLISEDFSALNGFSAGAAANWHFARKWGLRSGLYYAERYLPLDERPVVSLTAEDYEDATGNDVLNLGTGGTPSADPSTPVYVPIEKLKQLEMPLLAYWQPVNSLRVFGGISTAYILTTRASQRNFANNQYFVAADKLAQQNLSDLTTQTVSRWQVSGQWGLGVRIGKHFELDAFYRHGFGGNGDAGLDALDNLGGFNPANTPGQTLQNGSTSPGFLLNGIWFF